MAEAFVAVGFVGALVQLVEFGYKILKRMIHLRSRISPEHAKPFREIENQLPLLLSIIERVRARLDAHGVSEADEFALSRTIDGCHDQVRRLDALLDDIFSARDAPRIQQLWKSMRSMRKERRLPLIQQALENYKSTLTLYLTLGDRSRAAEDNSDPEQNIRYHVPSVQVSSFVGREVALVDMSQRLGPPSGPTMSPRIVVVLGMGGLGKTQFVLEYCRRAFTSQRFRAIFWADASTPTALSHSIANISEFLPGSRKAFADIAARTSFAKATLSRWSEPWLLVYDNFDQPGLFRKAPLQDYFPVSANGAIVVISRHAEAERLGPTIRLEIMSEDEGLDLLLRRSGLDTDPGSAPEGRNIVQRLGYLPLAIDQAGAYISSRKLGLQHFMDHFHERREAVLNHIPELWEYKKRLGDAIDDSALSVFTTWEMSFQQVGIDDTEKYKKTHFLTISAFLDNQNVSEDLFRINFESSRYPPDWMDIFSTNSEWDKYKFEDVLVELRNLSLIQGLDNKNQNFCRFSLHPLVQDWLKLRRNDSTRQRFTKETIFMLTTYLSETRVDQYPLDTRQITLSHLDACIQNDSEYLQEGDNLGTGSFRLSATRFASFYKRQARYKESKTLCERILEATEKEAGPNDPDTLKALSKLGNIYSKEGQYGEAELFYLRALGGQEKELGADHPDTLQTVLDLASGFFKKGQYNDAKPLFERALGAHERALGDNHLRTLWSAMNLGMVLKKQGHYGEANVLYQRAVEGQERELGDDHPETLKTVMNMASAKLDQGDYIVAESLSKRVVAGREKHLGPDHPNTLRGFWNLARVYSAMGKYELSGSLYLRALGGQEEQLGPDHPFTLKTVKDLARLRHLETRLDDAESLYKRAIQGLGAKSGKDHPNTLSSIAGLANVYQDRGRFSDAQDLLDTALAGQEAQLGIDHPDTLRTKRDLGTLYIKEEQPEKAVTYLSSAYQGLEKALGSTHQDTRKCLDMLDQARRALLQAKE